MALRTSTAFLQLKLEFFEFQIERGLFAFPPEIFCAFKRIHLTKRNQISDCKNLLLVADMTSIAGLAQYNAMKETVNGFVHALDPKDPESFEKLEMLFENYKICCEFQRLLDKSENLGDIMVQTAMQAAENIYVLVALTPNESVSEEEPVSQEERATTPLPVDPGQVISVAGCRSVYF